MSKKNEQYTIHLQWILHGTWQASIAACSAGHRPIPMVQLVTEPRFVTCQRCKKTRQYGDALQKETTP